MGVHVGFHFTQFVVGWCMIQMSVCNLLCLKAEIGELKKKNHTIVEWTLKKKKRIKKQSGERVGIQIFESQVLKFLLNCLVLKHCMSETIKCTF